MIKKFIKSYIIKDKNLNRISKLVRYEGSLFNLNSDSFLENLIIRNGNFEPHIVDLSKSLISKNDIVLDIGANVGLHTLLFSKLVGEGGGGRVVAFEPNELNLERLKLNISLNQISNIQIESVAVADKIGVNVFYELSNNSENLGNHSFAYTDTIKKLKKEEEVFERRVLCTTIDDYCKNNKISPNFIKMDIEGFEFNALGGACQSLKSKELKALIIEFNSSRIRSVGLENNSYEEILSDFNCYEILAPNDYISYTSLVRYNFERDVRCDLLCLKRI